jgi:hypothetical protein
MVSCVLEVPLGTAPTSADVTDLLLLRVTLRTAAVGGDSISTTALDGPAFALGVDAAATLTARALVGSSVALNRQLAS